MTSTARGTGTPPAPPPSPPQAAAPPSERFVLSADRPADLSALEAGFTALWRQASERLGGEKGVPRACLWNLVVYSPPSDTLPMRVAAFAGRVVDPTQAQSESRIRRLLDEVVLSVPARLIHLRPLLGDPPQGAKPVQAWLTTHCVPTSGGGGTVCAEKIDLVAFGEAGASHFPALVRALLVPDLPISLLWLEDLPQKGRLLGQLRQQAQRILVDSRTFEREGALVELQELVRQAPEAFCDLGWMRLTPVRYLVARLFDPPGHAENLSRLESVRVEVTPEGRNAGFMLLGWLLARVGLRQFKAVDVGEGQQRLRWQVRRESRALPVELVTRAGFAHPLYDGLLSVTIHAGGDRYTLERVDEEHVSLDSPHHQEHHVALHGWSDAELVISGLGAGAKDPVYADALTVAAGLMDTEAWNQ